MTEVKGLDPAQVRSVAVLTGAGISAESGVPTFRGDGGLWKEYRAEYLATQEAFSENPELVREFIAFAREQGTEIFASYGYIK